MTNAKAENAVSIMGLGKRFIADSVVQLNLISDNPEDAYDILENDFDLVSTTNLRTGKEIQFQVGWVEVESVRMISVPEEEEIYIDMMESNVSEIWMSDFPTLDGRLLFEIDRYEVYECVIDDEKRYCMVNTDANKTYEMLIEMCFELLSRYLDEDNRYILLMELERLERAVNN